MISYATLQIHIPLQEETASLLLCDGALELISNILVLASLSVPFISKWDEVEPCTQAVFPISTWPEEHSQKLWKVLVFEKNEATTYGNLSVTLSYLSVSSNTNVAINESQDIKISSINQEGLSEILYCIQRNCKSVALSFRENDVSSKMAIKYH